MYLSACSGWLWRFHGQPPFVTVGARGCGGLGEGVCKGPCVWVLALAWPSHLGGWVGGCLRLHLRLRAYTLQAKDSSRWVGYPITYTCT